jgi:hypothetical protein
MKRFLALMALGALIAAAVPPAAHAAPIWPQCVRPDGSPCPPPPPGCVQEWEDQVLAHRVTMADLVPQ